LRTLTAYYALIDQIEKSDLHAAACVVDRTVHNPFTGNRPVWKVQVQAEVTAQLLVGCIGRRELVSVFLDGISTPEGVALDDMIRARVNDRFGATAVVAAAALNSKTSDMLQVADLVAGAIAFERRRIDGESGNPNSNKGKVAARLRVALGVATFDDGRAARVNIATYRGSRPSQKASLRVVQKPAV
jgi:hypothetical protein